MAQITSITSESLQAKIRELLPSQQGFGEDLQASNVILPVIDLTAAAQGTTTPEILLTAWDFSTGHATVANATTTLINTTGFWKVDLVMSQQSAGSDNGSIYITDGLTTKTIWEVNVSGITGYGFVDSNEFVVFLRAGDSLVAQTNSARIDLDISWRQIADVNGNLTNPLGFSPQ